MLGKIVETKEFSTNGINYGVIKGYIASWEPDARPGIYGVRDKIVKGAYADSIREHKKRNNRQVRLKDQHYRVIGGFPIDTVREDSYGLFGEGHINLELQQGRETYSLAKQGVLVDMSVGHIVKQEEIKDNFRHILSAELMEGSIVDEPANQSAKIVEVKSSSRSDLPILNDENYKWDVSLALERVMEMKFSQGNATDAFIGGILIADLIDGKLFAIPDAIEYAADEVKNASDQLIIERYYAKMNKPSPFEKKMFYTLDDVKSLSRAEIKDMLSATGIFSNGAVRAIIARMREDEVSHGNANALVEEIRRFTRSITNN